MSEKTEVIEEFVMDAVDSLVFKDEALFWFDKDFKRILSYDDN